MGTNGMAAVRPHGHEMPTGHAMVYRENGRTYMCSNDKMNDGTMLFDHTRDWRS
jgi:hypothetical protein